MRFVCFCRTFKFHAPFIYKNVVHKFHYRQPRQIAPFSLLITSSTELMTNFDSDLATIFKEDLSTDKVKHWNFNIFVQTFPGFPDLCRYFVIKQSLLMYVHVIVSVCMCVMNAASLPAADDGLAGQRQVKEGLAELEGQCIFQRLTINDQRQLILLPQRVSQGRTVSCQSGTSSLQGDKDTESRVWVFLKSLKGRLTRYSPKTKLQRPVRQFHASSTCFYWCLSQTSLLQLVQMSNIHTNKSVLIGCIRKYC